MLLAGLRHSSARQVPSQAVTNAIAIHSLRTVVPSAPSLQNAYSHTVFHFFSAQDSIVLQACVRIIARDLPMETPGVNSEHSQNIRELKTHTNSGDRSEALGHRPIRCKTLPAAAVVALAPSASRHGFLAFCFLAFRRARPSSASPLCFVLF